MNRPLAAVCATQLQWVGYKAQYDHFSTISTCRSQTSVEKESNVSCTFTTATWYHGGSFHVDTNFTPMTPGSQINYHTCAANSIESEFDDGGVIGPLCQHKKHFNFKIVLIVSPFYHGINPNNSQPTFKEEHPSRVRRSQSHSMMKVT